jgi:hypothetical protein
MLTGQSYPIAAHKHPSEDRAVSLMLKSISKLLWIVACPASNFQTRTNPLPDADW